MECCGHDGTYAMKVEGFEPSKRIGQKAFDGMKEADGRGLGHRLPAGRAAVRAARGQEAHAPDVDPGPGLPRGRLPDARAGEDGGRRRPGVMTKPVERSEIVDYQTYEEQRDRRSAQRVHGGEGAPPHPRGAAPHLPVREPRHDALPGPGDDARRADRQGGRHPPRDRDLQRAARAARASSAARCSSRSTTPRPGRSSSRSGSTSRSTSTRSSPTARRCARPSTSARWARSGCPRSST